MSESCKKCAELIPVTFCTVCGQKKHRRIDGKYIKEELQYTLLHTNSGFFYTLKHLLNNPGKTVREYINGNRVGHYKPILLVFVLSGLYVFLSSLMFDYATVFANQYAEMMPDDEKGRRAAEIASSAMAFTMKYYSFFMVLTIPVMSFFTWLVFKNWGYNYCENVVINCYYQALSLVLNIALVLPLQALLLDNESAFLFYPSMLALVIMLGTYLWMYFGLYQNHPTGKIILKILLQVIISVCGFLFLCVLAGVVVGIVMGARG